MSKELTEQWRERTLPEGYYYIRWSFNIDDEPSYKIDFYDRENFVGGAFINIQPKFIDEVMCAVPSFADLCELKQELEICKDDKADLYVKLCNALMQLEECKQKIHILNESAMNMENAIGSQADYFQQQISVLEDRLKEAETIIKLYFKNTQNATYKSLGMKDGYYKKDFIHAVAKEYLERYGVK